MADSTLRDLERRALETGDPRDAARYRRELARVDPHRSVALDVEELLAQTKAPRECRAWDGLDCAHPVTHPVTHSRTCASDTVVPAFAARVGLSAITSPNHCAWDLARHGVVHATVVFAASLDFGDPGARIVLGARRVAHEGANSTALRSAYPSMSGDYAPSGRRWAVRQVHLSDRRRAKSARVIDQARFRSWAVEAVGAPGSAEWTLIDGRARAQVNLCAATNRPLFAPRDGVCRRCRGQIYSVHYGDSHITHCPLCMEAF